MDHDYELEEDYAPRVLWGRIAFFLVALIFAFVAGRACAPDSAVSQSDYEEQKRQVLDLASENAVLQQQVDAAANAPQKDKGKKNDGGTDEEPTEAEDEQPIGDGQTYKVQPNDTLTKIAQKFYGDPRKFDLIVDANNLDGTTNLRVGQELLIPADD